MARTEYGTTWWGRKWLDALTGIDYANRIPRGKSYANTDKVYSLTLDEKRGLIKARVKGHYDPFYSVKIVLPQVTREQADAFIAAIAKYPVILAKLSSRELAPEVSEIAAKIGIHVFPQRWDDLKLSCSCPDFAVPCKHIAAVIYKFSQEIDANPFVLFSLRGIDIFKGLKDYGVNLEMTQVSEMPRWQDLISQSDPAGPLPLNALRDLSYTTFPDITPSVMGLFSDRPAGYTEGSLKEVLAKTIARAQRQAAQQLKDQTDRDLPKLSGRQFLQVSAWGRLTPGQISWTVYPPGEKPQTFSPKELPEQGYICEMFGGGLDLKRLETAPEELEALYHLWLIALKLVASGSIMPQIFEPLADFISIRWIPAVISDEVMDAARKTGQALLSLPPGFIEIDRAPEQLGATALGQTALSLFISSFMRRAYHYILKDTHDSNPDRAALFLGEQLDMDAHLNGEAIKMRLEAWLSPLYLEQLTVKPVIVFSDESAGELSDYVDERREYAAPEDAPADPETAAAAYMQRAFTTLMPEHAPLNEAAEPAVEAAEVGVHSYAEGDTFFDGHSVVHAEVMQEPGPDPDEKRSLFDNAKGVGIAMGFKQGSGPALTFISLKQVLEDKAFSDIRFECLRTVSRLSQICPPLTDLLKNRGGEGIVSLDDLAHVVSSAVPALKLLGVELIIPKTLKRILYPKSAITLHLDRDYNEGTGLMGIEQMLDFDWQIAIGNEQVTEPEFDELCRHAGRIVRFRNSFVYVDPNEVSRIAKHLQMGRGTVNPKRLIAAALTGKFGEDNVLLSKQLKDALQQLLSEKEIAVPDTLRAKLRPYQERGYSWLVRNLKTSLGSIIADDMGLGKTLQVIAALEKLRADGALEEKGALVVVPTTLLHNWQHELRKFAPQLTYKVIYGAERDFKTPKHVTITTYGILRTENAKFKKVPWRVMVIDEAQAIKTHTSLIFKAVRSIKADAFIAMSGTPVENRLLEYWSIMDFVNPGLLGSADGFKREFAQPIERSHDAEAIKRFKQVTAPFIMRRLKSDKSVISDLPEKISYDKYCTLTKEQTALYNEVVGSAMELLQNTDRKGRSGIVLNLIASLKMICNAPEQYTDNSPYQGAKYSGKAQMLFDLLDHLFRERRKVLIFTQFKRTGNLICQWLEERYSFKPDFLHGEIPVKERTRMVNNFQNERSCRALVLSLKAAGTGLNLTAASAVVHFDLWWNPAVEAQATDRAYRIGQKQQVEIFRFICSGTFEEKINALMESKKELADLTVGAGEHWIGEMSDRQLKDLFAISEQDEELQEEIAGRHMAEAAEDSEAAPASSKRGRVRRAG